MTRDSWFLLGIEDDLGADGVLHNLQVWIHPFRVGRDHRWDLEWRLKVLVFGYGFEDDLDTNVFW